MPIINTRIHYSAYIWCIEFHWNLSKFIDRIYNIYSKQYNIFNTFRHRGTRVRSLEESRATSVVTSRLSLITRSCQPPGCNLSRKKDKIRPNKIISILTRNPDSAALNACFYLFIIFEFLPQNPVFTTHDDFSIYTGCVL